MRILVVDDEPALRSSLERALRLDALRRASSPADGHDGARPARGRAGRRGRARRGDAEARRARGLPPPARGRRPHAGADADRARRDRRPRRRARRRRRRLPRQAVRAARAAGAAARAAATRRGAVRARPALRRPRARPARAPGVARRARARAVAHRVRAAAGCSWSTRARCSAARSCSSACGATTSARPRTRSASTSATCGARPRRAASRGCCTRCAGSATCCGSALMGLRRRLTLLAAGAVGVTVVLASVVCYLVDAHELRAQVDDALGRQGGLVAAGRARARDRPGCATAVMTLRLPAPPPRAGGSAPYVQVLDAAGKVTNRGDERLARHHGHRARQAGRGRHGQGVRGRPHDRRRPRPGQHGADAGRRRVPCSAAASPAIDSTLSRLRWLLLALCVAGTALAAALGRAVLAPGHPAGHGPHRGGRAHHGRPRTSRGASTSAAATRSGGWRRASTRCSTRSRARSRRSGGSSPTRRTSCARRSPACAPTSRCCWRARTCRSHARRRLLEDVREQTEELSALITDVIELARGEVPLSGTEDVRLDEIAAVTAGRVGRSHRDVRFAARPRAERRRGPARPARAARSATCSTTPPSTGRRAASSRSGVRGGEVAVRDHGPGVPGAEAPFVFDRFYRGDGARGRQGSGLGLAIVRQVAESHGGGVTVEEAPGGGALFRLRLPVEETLTTPSRRSQESGVE